MFGVSAYWHVWNFLMSCMGGMGIFITYSDDYSRFGYVHRKSNALDTSIEFKVGSNNLYWVYTPSHFD